MPEDSLLGRQLANFQIAHVLGRGGMATVYYGQDIKLERPVAIKVIDARHRDNPAYAERFVREAQAVAKWRHENIVQIFYADDDNGLYYFVMEYIDGPDLSALIAQYRQAETLMPQADVLQLGWAIAKALDYAHQQGVIHRDLKPANIMVDAVGRVILTDFGLAMDLYQGSLGEVFGTSYYVAPEQARRSADAVPQSDLYSLGILLYELLTGSLPFDDPSPTTVALQHVTQPPPPPREVNPQLSAAVEAVLLTALSKTPAERYQTGQALLEALEAALQLPPSPPAPPASDQVAPFSIQAMVTRHLQEKEAAITDPTATDTPRPTDSLLGEQLDEYFLDELVGQGGMARVYRAKDTNLERYVAIKVIDTPFQSESGHVERFKREAQTIAQLEHPHIVRLYRYGEAAGLLYMAMQYIEGAELGELLAEHHPQRNPFPADDACRIIREVGQALDYAHERGVIHRDVKPSNILLNEQKSVILTDFGLALMTELGTQGQIFGSPHYIAPEQAMSSANVVPQSDLYSLGVILYELFTGQLPFHDDDPLDLAMKHMTEMPPPPRSHQPDLSPELEAMLLKALAKDPAERYQTGAELVAALEAALFPEPEPEPEPEPVSEPVSKPTPVPIQPSAPSVPDAPLPETDAPTPTSPVAPDMSSNAPQEAPTPTTGKSLPLPPVIAAPPAEPATATTDTADTVEAPMPEPVSAEASLKQRLTTRLALQTLLRDRRLLVMIGLGIGILIGLLAAIAIGITVLYSTGG